MVENSRLDLFSDVEQRIRRNNKILFSRDSACLKELLDLIGQHDHRTLVLWALDCAVAPVQKILDSYPAEQRPGICLDLCHAWARGEIRMPQAKRAILEVHAAAKEHPDPVYAALCHAVGQAGATVHTKRHAPGLLFYELTAIVLEHGSRQYEEAVFEKIRFYRQRLIFWQAEANQAERKWAAFLMDKQAAVSSAEQTDHLGGDESMENQNWKKKLSDKDRTELVGKLKERFEKNRDRHQSVDWDQVETALNASPDKLQALYAMEVTGGEPDVIAPDKDQSQIVFCDCSPETPAGRRKLSYDDQAKEERKHGKPDSSAKGMAKEMGIALLSEKEYFMLQKLGSFDLKTSSWVETPPEIRAKGGALFGDCRYGRVFIYHNGAESWYSARGFRGILRV